MSLEGQPPKTHSEYREFIVPARLAAHFLCFWTQTIIGSRGVYEHRVLPDACVDIVFINDEPPMVFGPWTVPFVARLTVGTSITGARLHPGRASSLLGMPASELLNQAVPIVAVKGAMQNMRLGKVIEQPNAAARRLALAQLLFASVERSAPFDHAVMAGIRWLSRHPDGRIGQLSHWIGMSERQLHRRFSAAIGYGPKMFQSVLRFQRLLKHLWTIANGSRKSPMKLTFAHPDPVAQLPDSAVRMAREPPDTGHDSVVERSGTFN